MLTARTIILWMHLAAIVVWLGGMVAIPFIVAPVIRRTAGLDAMQILTRRFQRLSRELVLAILLTGIFNLIFVGALTRFNFSTEYLAVVGVKFTILMLMLANQLWYSYRLVPRWADGRDGHRTATLSAVANVVLGAIVLFLGLNLRTV